MISISNHVIAASLELPINLEVGHYSPHLISVRFGAADNTLTIDNAKMDVRCGYYRAAELTEFPFCYPGTWTPREEEPLVTADAWIPYDFKPLDTTGTPGIDEPAVDEWEPTKEPIEPNCLHCQRVAVNQQSCCSFHY